MRVLLIRERERCEKTAARLSRDGHEAIILPLAEYHDTGEAVPAMPFDAIAFTSAAAVESLSRRIGCDDSLARLRQAAAFCVGEATAAAARELGFDDVRNAAGDSARLAGLIAGSSLSRQGARLLYPTQPSRAFDLSAALPQWQVCDFNAYEARQTDPGRAAFASAVQHCDVVFLYSPRSAGHFVGLLVKHVTSDALPRLTLIAISEKTAEATRTSQNIGAGHGFSTKNDRFHILVAASPDENAMFSLLGAGNENI
jgi:uroporphyrinogen-III synthase